MYRWHTGYPGGLKSRTANELWERKPDQVLRKAIVGMLKKNNLRHQSIEPRLKVYTGPTHPHTAQLGTLVTDDDTTTTATTAQSLPRHPRSHAKQILFDNLPYTQEITVQGAAGASSRSTRDESSSSS